MINDNNKLEGKFATYFVIVVKTAIKLLGGVTARSSHTANDISPAMAKRVG